MEFIFEVAVLNTSAATPQVNPLDPTSDNPMIRVFIKYKKQKFLAATVSLGAVRTLTTNPVVVAGLTSMCDGTTNPTPMTDQSITNEDFVKWASGFPDSVLTPIFRGMTVRP